jgi:peroxiredoxin
MNIPRWLPLALAGAALIFATAATAQQQLERRLYLPIGSEAPAVEGITVDGQPYSLADKLANGPVFLVFWKDPCPHNPRAMPFFNALTEAYEGKVQLVSVVRSTPEGAVTWRDEFQPQHPLLVDPDRELVDAYVMFYSVVPVQIGTDGVIVDIFDGYGRAELQRLNEAMAAALGLPVADVDLSRAPERHPTYG